MSYPSKEKVIGELQRRFEVKLLPMPSKRILYNGKLPNGKTMIVCTPYSRLNEKGRGWTDLTEIQVSLMNKADFSIVAFRLEGEKVYYVSFHDLYPLLKKDTMIYNDKEGDHWKLHIWPSEIQVLGERNRLPTSPNNLDNISLN